MHIQKLSSRELRRCLRTCAVYLEALLTGDREALLTLLTTCKGDRELTVGEGAGAQSTTTFKLLAPMPVRRRRTESPRLEEGLTTALDEDRL